MAMTASERRPSFEPRPPAMVESAAIPVNVIVSTVVVNSGTASLRAVAFWTPIAKARSTISA